MHADDDVYVDLKGIITYLLGQDVDEKWEYEKSSI